MKESNNMIKKRLHKLYQEHEDVSDIRIDC